jgi:hypothetical protein
MGASSVSAPVADDEVSFAATVPPIALPESSNPRDPANEFGRAMQRRRAHARVAVFAAVLILPVLAWVSLTVTPDQGRDIVLVAAAVRASPPVALAPAAPSETGATAEPSPRVIALGEQVLGEPARTSAAAPSSGKGTIDIAARSGRCRFFIDGKPRATDWRLKVEVSAGVHEAACARVGGGYRAQTVRIAPGERKVVLF